ncbi:hypothetical protein DPEC_G00235590 [Dallia pectoralis]|uniref:Uncharacterized protein n=1 Tax=Dallia pectoralis TaxID=75939 RepID=A0ACC2FXX8_DALPE|nr:hypothetical protein DPEC_G00235590 [Dallia pectoralis]
MVRQAFGTRESARPGSLSGHSSCPCKPSRLRDVSLSRPSTHHTANRSPVTSHLGDRRGTVGHPRYPRLPVPAAGGDRGPLCSKQEKVTGVSVGVLYSACDKRPLAAQ